MSEMSLPLLPPIESKLMVINGAFEESRMFSDEGVSIFSNMNSVIDNLSNSVSLLSLTHGNTSTVLSTGVESTLGTISDHLSDLVGLFRNHTNTVVANWIEDDKKDTERLRLENKAKENDEALRDREKEGKQTSESDPYTTDLEIGKKSILGDILSSLTRRIALMTGAIVVVIEGLYTYSDKISEAFGSFTTRLNNFFTLSSNKEDGGYELEGAISGFMPAVYGKFLSSINALKQGVLGASVLVAANPVIDALKAVKTAISDKLSLLAKPMSNAVASIKNIKGFNTISKTIAPMIDTIKAFGSIVVKWSATTRLFKAVSIVGNAVSKTISFFSKTISLLPKFMGVLGGIISKVAYPLTIIMGVWNGINEGIKGYEEGGWSSAIGKGLAGIVNSVFGGLLDLVKSGVSSILGWLGADNASAWLDSFKITDIISSLFTTEFWSNIGNSMAGAVVGMKDSITALASEYILDPIKSIFKTVANSLDEMRISTLKWLKDSALGTVMRVAGFDFNSKIASIEADIQARKQDKIEEEVAIVSKPVQDFTKQFKDIKQFEDAQLGVSSDGVIGTILSSEPELGDGVIGTILSSEPELGDAALTPHNLSIEADIQARKQDKIEEEVAIVSKPVQDFTKQFKDIKQFEDAQLGVSSDGVIGTILSSEPELGDAALTPHNLENLKNDLMVETPKEIADQFNLIKQHGGNESANQFLANTIRENRGYMEQIVQAIYASQQPVSGSTSNTTNIINAAPSHGEPN